MWPLMLFTNWLSNEGNRKKEPGTKLVRTLLFRLDCKLVLIALIDWPKKWHIISEWEKNYATKNTYYLLRCSKWHKKAKWIKYVLIFPIPFLYFLLWTWTLSLSIWKNTIDRPKLKKHKHFQQLNFEKLKDETG